MRAQPRSGERGRPGPEARPDQVIYQIDGALASALTARHALIDQHCGFILAINQPGTPQLLPQAVLEGDKGQGTQRAGADF